MIIVTARKHPLALFKGVIPKTELATNTATGADRRAELTAGQELGVMSRFTWRLDDIFAKHAFLLKGLGCQGRPLHAVKQDLQEGRLAKLSIEASPDEGLISARSRSSNQIGGTI
jgi:hypothetical protein